MNPFGMYLITLRLKHRFKQKDLASAIGVHPCYISMIESGKKALLLASFKSIAVIVALICLISASGIFFVHFRSLLQLIDKESCQNKMRTKKEALESKLESR